MPGDKFLYLNSGVPTEKAAIQSSTGSGDAGKIPALDSNGKLDNSMMPTGIGADTQSITATENLSAGDLVNVYTVSGAARVRKADATTAGKEAVGYVLSSVTSGNAATVYFEQLNNGVTGLTPGSVYYLSTTAGGVTATPPSSSGNVIQRIGRATAAGVLTFQPGDVFVLA